MRFKIITSRPHYLIVLGKQGICKICHTWKGRARYKLDAALVTSWLVQNVLFVVSLMSWLMAKLILVE